MGSSIGSSEELDVSGLHEDKIFVSIRLRPLNEREISRRDACDWECIDRNTLVFRHTLPERSMYPSAYTFDRVFGCDSTTKQVYEEGAREVALSVVSGINSSVFAYGQTSSGKTYTMCGITAFAVADIYDYIEKHKDREFVLKFSAMEIYNEAVRDLLSTDSTPLRLLDDPERGTVVERLTEETLRDRNHLAELLYICEAQRKIGETSLNETSSRSHQILRLTIESAASDYFRAENSSTLSATVNFIDLAGSERASQTLSAGTRLKEGCHINRSLLTLGTVIRKLSKGRNGHVPYRDSKLTRILQNSLGGNARTAIICTMSPARSHVEQSRNTLLFASCAKEVSTNAQVNVVMSDKALVKQLQKELARLESHLRSIESTSMPGDAAALLRERELQIEKMEKEIKEVTLERDLAQARVEELLRLVGDDRASRIDEYSSSGDSSEIIDPLHVDAEGFRMCKASKKYFDQPRISSSSNHYLQVPEIPDNNYLLELHHDEKSEDICKDVQCIEEEEPRNMGRTIETTHVTIPSPDRKETKSVMEVPINEDEMNSPPKEDRESNHDYICDTLKHENKDLDTDEDAITIASPRKEETLTSVESSCDTLKQENENQDTYEDEISSPKKEDRDVEAVSSPKKEDVEELNHTNGSMSCPQKEGNHTNNAECGCEALQQKVEEMKKTMTRLFSQNILEQTPSTKLARSRSCSEVLTPLSSSPWFEVAEKDANAPPSTHEVEMISRKPEQKSKPRSGVKKETFSRIDSSKSVLSACLPAEHTNMSEEDIIDVNNFYRGLKEIAKHRSDSQIDENLEGTEYEDANDEVEEEEDEFKEINENAEAVVVNVQPQDEWKMEFQRQRSQIIELWDQCYVPLVHRSYFFLLFNGDPSDSIYMEVELRRLSFLKTSLERKINLTKSTLTPTKASSIKALTREREMLSKLVHKKLERSEREALYKEWGINLNTKQRSLQMANKVWTDTKETKHVEESAALVAKLVQLMEPGRHLPKEMFGLSFSAAPPLEKRSYSWRN